MLSRRLAFHDLFWRAVSPSGMPYGIAVLMLCCCLVDHID